MLLGAALSAAWDASRIDDRPSPLDDVPFGVIYFVILACIPATATLLARHLATRR